MYSRGICNRGLAALSAAFETNTFMIRLRISACNVDAQGFNVFLKALAQNETLESVDASENALGSQATKHLATVDWAALPPSVLFWTLRRCGVYFPESFSETGFPGKRQKFRKTETQ